MMIVLDETPYFRASAAAGRQVRDDLAFLSVVPTGNESGRRASETIPSHTQQRFPYV